MLVRAAASCAWLWIGIMVVRPSIAQDADWFETRIRPVLVDKCQECHGAVRQWAGLRLDTPEFLAKGSENGPVIDGRDPSASRLLVRIESDDPDERMPPPESTHVLSPDEREWMRRWVMSGAVFPASPAPGTMVSSGSPESRAEIAAAHWAFRPLPLGTHAAWVAAATPRERAEGVGHAQLPTASSTVPHWIDRLIQDTLDSRGIVPLAAADRRTQLRRLHRAVAGLLPTWEDVQRFEEDASEQAWEHAIDRVVYGPETAEKWARVWMDVARYSDTKGYVYGREERTFVFARAYRDWLIHAFSEDMPYDRFIELQLAADQLVPEGSPDLAAMGFLTLGRRFLAIQYDIIDDRIDTTFRGLMGLTVQCARCHDHKFDPISLRDYYGFVGIFQSCIDARQEIPSRLQGQTEEFRQGLVERKAKLRELTDKNRTEANDRIQKRFADYLETQVELDKYPEGSFNQLSTKDDLIPAMVHRWEWHLGLRSVANHPVIRLWTELSQLPKENYQELAGQAIARIDQDPGACDPVVRKHFQTSPASVRELADRYGAIVAEASDQWQAEVARRIDRGDPMPTTSEDPAFESRRSMLLDRASGFYIPDEPIDSTEWYWDNGTCVEIWKAQNEVDQWLMQIADAPVELGILRDRGTVSDARLLKRGNANWKGDATPRRYFEHLQGGDERPFEMGSGRLELARRIASPDNPLTARVWVNRVWQQLFGEGLVQSMSDFGLRSDVPSHPELLDQLAAEFIRHGWSTRWLIREVVSTEAFRRSSVGSHPRAIEIDPSNRLLWRGNRHRLTWEESRDAMLMCGGTLARVSGGKPVDPLANSDDAMARRSVYTAIDRQYLPMTLQNFDFANPDMHSPKRSETTVPQQALFFLNHPLPAKAANRLVEAIERSSDGEPVADAGFVERLYRRVLQREPSPAELETGVGFLEEAGRAIGSGGLSARAQLSQVLLICNEVIYID